MAHPCEAIAWGPSDWSDWDPIANSMEIVSGKCEFGKYGYNWALGERGLGWGTAAGGLLMLAGVLVHLAEAHEHEHVHEALEHEHAHRHDDGHHDHLHDPMPEGEHSHPHRHEPTRHSHPHVPDVHHTHRH